MVHISGQKSENHKKYGYGAQNCKICKRHRGIIHKYGLELCRQCFRDVAEKMGWKKYN